MCIMMPTIRLIFIALVASLLQGPCRGQVTPDLEEVYAWKLIDYAWATPEDRAQAIANGKYIPENNYLIGVKIWNNTLYVNVARWLPGVPSTLNTLPIPTEGLPLSTPLMPFPNWAMQQEGDCSVIQFIQGMEIDTLGRMWAVDIGRRNVFTSSADNSCPPKLLLLDLNSGGIVLHTFIFPPDVVSYNDNFLNDLVVHEGLGTNWYAYITDANSTSGAIVVYSLEQDRAWRIENAATMKAEVGNASTATVGGVMVSLNANAWGIALSPKDEDNVQVFYYPLGSFNLYSIPASVLQQPPANPSQIASFITNWGKRSSQGAGMMMDSTGDLYFGLLIYDSLAKWPANVRLTGAMVITSTAVVVAQDSVRLQWIERFGFDSYNRVLWLVSNRLQNLETLTVNPNEINYRILRLPTGTQSYQYNRYTDIPI